MIREKDKYKKITNIFEKIELLEMKITVIKLKFQWIVLTTE